jgi:hypothetical protein
MVGLSLVLFEGSVNLQVVGGQRVVLGQWGCRTLFLPRPSLCFLTVPCALVVIYNVTTDLEVMGMD